MVVIAHRALREFYETRGREDSKEALKCWYAIVKRAQWKNLAELKSVYPRTDYVGNDRYVFNIKGNKYRIVALILFQVRTVYIRFVGTHEEYDKIDCSTI
ncbi:MAG: type II toxin-antitoxin system HigB family toxin [Fermentimonas sp.]|jgi:mRNA interferase HigB